MEADEHSRTARTGDGGQVAGGSAFYTLPLVVLEMIVRGLLPVGHPLKNPKVTKTLEQTRGYILLEHNKLDRGGPSYQFLNRLSQVLLVLDHGHHVLVYSRRQNNVQGLRFHGHVADHLIMGEHIVPVQHAVVVDTLPPQWHLTEEDDGLKMYF